MAHAGFPKGLDTTPDEIAKKIANDSDEKGNNTAEIGIKICEADYQDKGLGRIILSIFIKDLLRSLWIRI